MEVSFEDYGRREPDSVSLTPDHLTRHLAHGSRIRNLRSRNSGSTLPLGASPSGWPFLFVSAVSGLQSKSVRTNVYPQIADSTPAGVSEYYWIRTTNCADPSEAWTVLSCDFGVHDTPKAFTGYTFIV